MERFNAFYRLLQGIAMGAVGLLPVLVASATETGLSESLQKALQAQGWQAETAADGSLIYRRSVPEVVQPESESAPQPEPLSGSELDAALKDRGWRLERSADGGLILKPQSLPAEQPSVPGVNPPATQSSLPDSTPDHPGFDYWRIERQPDGTLHFYPLPQRGTPETTGSTADLQPCMGVEIPNAGVELPVDRWSEARDLAHGWLNDRASADLQLGKIRKVLGIYLISLVHRAPPYHLKHQLAVRASDGRVMLLE